MSESSDEVSRHTLLPERPAEHNGVSSLWRGQVSLSESGTRLQALSDLARDFVVACPAMYS